MNQPPQPQQTGKRIVSKGEYAKIEGKRAGLVLSGGVFVLLGTFCVILTVILTMFSVYLFAACCVFGYFSAYFFAFLLAASLFGSCAYGCAKLSDASTEKAKKIEEVLPFTRANTADLPANDSLVRASSEPVQEPQAVLLRAATGSVERHEEQLVRAVRGEE